MPPKKKSSRQGSKKQRRADAKKSKTNIKKKDGIIRQNIKNKQQAENKANLKDLLEQLRFQETSMNKNVWSHHKYDREVLNSVRDNYDTAKAAYNEKYPTNFNSTNFKSKKNTTTGGNRFKNGGTRKRRKRKDT